jgi:hypothetical protein
MPNNPGYTAVVITGESISVTIDGEPTTIAADAPNYADLLAAVKKQAPADKVRALLTPAVALKAVAKEGGFEIRMNPNNPDAIGVFWNGSEVHSKVSGLLLEMYHGKQDITALRNFLIKAMAHEAIKEIDLLYDFIIKNKLPLHPDGDFLAFKTTRVNGLDKHSGTVKYEIGKELEVTNFNRDKFTQCGAGLHVGGRNYVKGFGSTGDAYFIVKVNPANAIYYRDGSEHGKMRVCKLFVYAQCIGGAELEQFLPFMVMRSPEGDLLELATKEDIAAGTADTSPTMGHAHESTVVAKSATGKGKRSAKKLKKLKKVQTFVTGTAKAENLKFVTKAGRTYTAADVLAGVKDHGQRGWAALAGIARTTIQEWLKAIKGEQRTR